jgi:lipid-A-disaccharide synthase
MNLPFANVARRNDVPVLYYIAPQVWASREWRLRKMRRRITRVACILPFEEQYFRRHGIDATFVGHPLFDDLPAERDLRERPLFPARPPVVGIIPGSRRSEVAANFPHQLEVAQRIRAAHPGARFLVPSTPNAHELVNQIAGDTPDMRIEADSFDRQIPQCDLVLCKSGTSTLHVAAYGVPMIVVYRIDPVLWHLAGRWLVKTPYVALVNILAGNVELVPEYVPWYGSNEPVAQCALELLADPSRLDEQRTKLDRLIAPLDRRGASMNAARIAMDMMKGT